MNQTNEAAQGAVLYELLPCPFCAAVLEPFGLRQHNHPRNGCWLASVKVEWSEYSLWNLRAALKAQPAPTEAQCEGSAQVEWISVEDRLPELGQQVIAFRPTAALTQDEPISFIRFTGRATESWQGVAHGFDCICHPTHWMPLPAAPQLQEKP